MEQQNMQEFKVPEISLTLDPFQGNGGTKEKEEENLKKVDTAGVEQLSPEEREMVHAFAQKIDLSDTTSILQYGAGTQQKLADFSDQALSGVRNHDLGETGEVLANLVGELQDFSDDMDDKGIFHRGKRKLVTLKAKYDKTSVSVNNVVDILQGHQVTLLKDISMLDKLYDTNLVYFKELSMYILAGKEKLAEARNTTLAEMRAKAEKSGLPEDAQTANDFAALCDRFEKKIYDLELSRMVSIQMAPQIRLVQSNDASMSEKIQSTIVNTIPLWKSQMIIALGLSDSEEAMKAERAVNDMTNTLLRQNAEKLHQSTVDIARENERGIVDIETLTYTNQQLITTLDEVRAIREEGREKRAAAEAELGRIENEMKQKLLELRG